MMPGEDGLTLTRELRETLTTPILLLTAKGEADDRITGLEAGADDYLTKPVYFVELTARINNGMRVLELERNLKEAGEEIYHLTVTDSLTDTFNRRYLNENMPEAIDTALAQSSPFSLVLCDIDHFKKVNDTYGHVIGDAVLRSFARIIRDTLNDQQDWVVRYGGEEFLLVLPGTDIDGARELSEMLREFVAQATIKASGHDINITASFGVAGLDSLNDTAKVTPEKLLDLADENLYKAKEEGRNRVVG